MKQVQNGRSRRYVVLVRRWRGYPVGTRLQIRNETFEADKMKEYTGHWPPKSKTKFNLKDLK